MAKKVAFVACIEFVSVDDELPDEGISVLVACGHPANESLDVFEAIRDADKGGWTTPDGCCAQHVRYWAEMPGCSDSEKLDWRMPEACIDGTRIDFTDAGGRVTRVAVSALGKVDQAIGCLFVGRPDGYAMLNRLHVRELVRVMTNWLNTGYLS